MEFEEAQLIYRKVLEVIYKNELSNPSYFEKLEEKEDQNNWHTLSSQDFCEQGWKFEDIISTLKVNGIIDPKMRLYVPLLLPNGEQAYDSKGSTVEDKDDVLIFYIISSQVRLENEYSKFFQPEKKVGQKENQQNEEGLVMTNEQTFRYNGKPIKLRNQLRTMLQYFVDREGQIVTPEGLMDAIIDSHKRPYTSRVTISKYVCELRGILNSISAKEIRLENQKDAGWILRF